MNDTPLTSNQMAQERTDLAVNRTFMALERSLMAWIRTALSLISFGFTLFKFLQALQDKGGAMVRENAPRNIGLFLILLGMGSLTMAIFEFKSAMAKVMFYTSTKPQISIAMIASIGVLLVGVFAALNVLFGLGGF